VKRGDLITVSAKGDYGKPRPALIIQSDLFSEHHSVIVLLLTGSYSRQTLYRVDILPDDLNGLAKPSQVMVDKPVTVRREKIGSVFGSVSEDILQKINQLIPVWFGLV